jgi:hypothetical protein
MQASSWILNFFSAKSPTSLACAFSENAESRSLASFVLAAVPDSIREMIQMLFANSKKIWLVASLFVLNIFVVAGRPAWGGIVFRDLNVTLDASLISDFDLDVDLDGTIDFRFTSAFIPDPTLSVGFNQVKFPFASGNGIVIDAFTGDGFPAASRLSLGNLVSNASLFSSSSDLGNLSFLTTPDPVTGNFEGQTGYLGLKFDRLGGTSFGFAQISVNAANAAVNPFGLTLFNVAYNDTLGEGATISAVPEPSGMLLASLGVGLLAWGRFKRPGRAEPVVK